MFSRISVSFFLKTQLLIAVSLYGTTLYHNVSSSKSHTLFHRCSHCSNKLMCRALSSAVLFLFIYVTGKVWGQPWLSFELYLICYTQLFLLKKLILLEYSCFTMLYVFLLYRKMNQLYLFIYPLLFGFPSHLGQHSALSSSLPYSWFSFVVYFIHSINSIYVSISVSQFLPTSPLVLSVLHVSVSISYFANKIIYTVVVDSICMH